MSKFLSSAKLLQGATAGKRSFVGVARRILRRQNHYAFETRAAGSLGWRNHVFAAALINTAALARCTDALGLDELFQQFEFGGENAVETAGERASFAPPPG